MNSYTFHHNPTHVVSEHRPPRVPTPYRPAYQPPDASSFLTFSEVSPAPPVQLVGKPPLPSSSSEVSMHDAHEPTNEPVTIDEPVTPCCAVLQSPGNSVFGMAVAGQVPRMMSMGQLPVGRAGRATALPPPRPVFRAVTL